jgi:DNA-binding FrmR family transcriptional regulator
VLDSHVQGCVRDAMVSGGEEAEAKAEELLEAVERFARMR